MEKDALLEIILHDLSEVETLVKSFRQKPAISNAFLKLTRSKINSILEEIEMLEEFSGNGKPANQESSFSEEKETESILPKSERIKETTMDVKGTDKKDPEPSQQQKPQEPEKQEENSTPPPFTSKEAEKDSVSAPIKETPEITESSVKNQSGNPQLKTDSPVENPSETKENQIKTTEPETSTGHKVLGEKFVSEKASYNEKIGQNQPKQHTRSSVSRPPVADLKKAIGINDRFLFQRELFKGNADLMNQTIDQLNQMKNFKDARNFLLSNFSWDSDNETVISLLDLVERRFL